MFHTTNFENFVLFIDSAKSEENPLKDSFKITIDLLFQRLNLYQFFTEDIKEKEEVVGQLDNYTKGVIESFKEALTKNPMDIFKEYDLNKNGTLSSDELFQCIDTLAGDQLNDSQKLLVLQVADKNNDDNINYSEFVNFLNLQLNANKKHHKTEENSRNDTKSDAKRQKTNNNEYEEEIDTTKKISTLKTKTKISDKKPASTMKMSDKDKTIRKKSMYGKDQIVKGKSTIEDEEAPYQLKASDYYEHFDGTICHTILNSEEAALTKCEELANEVEKDEHFLDKDFGSQTDNANKSKYSLFITGAAPKGQLDASHIEWYRMAKICQGESPKFIEQGASSNDLMQGAIGDCWFISALAVLATKDHLLKGQFDEKILDDGVVDSDESIMLSTGVYPPIFHAYREKLIFCFKFYKDFAWRYVIIDDRLPCRKVREGEQPKLLYAKCREEIEFWVPLIEKAFAKLHMCYESLVSGFIDDGLVDLTGNVARKIFITQEDMKKREKIEQLWQTITKYTSNNTEEITNKYGKKIEANIFTNNNSMMGCSIDAKVVESEVN